MRERPNRTKTFLKVSGLIIGLTVGITVATAPAAAGGRIIYENERYGTYEGHGKKRAYKKGYEHGYNKGQKRAYRHGHGYGKHAKKYAYKHGYKKGYDKGYKHGHKHAYKQKRHYRHGHGYKHGKPIYNFVFGFPGQGSWAPNGYRQQKRARHYRYNRCHPVSRIGYDRYGRKVKFGGTMCYDRYGASYIVRGSRHIIHYY